MQLSLLNIFVLLAVPVAVSSCEGPCIVGITNAFLGNYTGPIQGVLKGIGNEIAQKLIPNHAHASDPLNYLSPIITAYNNQSYAALETAVFPGYFHGKCQQNGVDPKGCPNPDCPVVCGTPGSLVHFYAKLREIAFNEIQKLLGTLGTPGSDAYNMVEKAVTADARRPARRMLRVYSRSASNSLTAKDSSLLSKREENDLKAKLKEIMLQIPASLEKACGSTAKGLPDCSWEVAMKKYILSWP